MLQAIPKNRLSSDYMIIADTVLLAEVKLSWWRESGEVMIEGQAYRLYRDGLTSPFVLECNGVVVARAVKPSMWTRRLEVEIPGRHLTLDGAGCLRRGCVLQEHGIIIGEMTQTAFFSRNAQIAFPTDLSLATQVFLAWLVLMMWRRDDSATTTTTAIHH